MEQSQSRRILHRSLPALGLGESVPETRNPIKLYRKKRKNGNTTYIISAFYGQILIILGVALPVTNALVTKEHNPYNSFYLYLYIGSIIYLLYMYYVYVKGKVLESNLKIGSNSDSNESLNRILKRKQHVRYGSFYFRMGVTGFGVGSVIYSGVQFAQYFELAQSKECNDLMLAIKPLLRIVFALMQILFIFSYSNYLHVQKTKIIARFGLMHMLATNMCEWLQILVQETQKDIYKSAKERLDSVAKYNKSLSETDSQFLISKTFQVIKHLYKHKFECLKSNVIESILLKLQNYLLPCTVEYSLLCAVILLVIWKNNCGFKDTTNVSRESSEIETKGKQSGCNIIYSRRQSQFSVDCAQVYKGLFSGILVLAFTTVSLIMFFELVTYENLKKIAILQVNIWEAILFWAGTVAAIFCTIALRDVGLRKMKRDLELEHFLLLVTQCAVFMYFSFQIIGGILMGSNKGTVMRIITPISALIQSSCQTVLVMDAWRRRCTTLDQMQRKPGRQLITFLLLTNIALWIGNHLKNNLSFSHPNQMDFYGVLAWNIITHVSIPLVVSYRFQSTVCLYEIWKHVYKMRPINKKLNEFNRDTPI